MSAEVFKTWPNPGVLECPNALRDAINDDDGINAICEQVLVDDGVNITITFNRAIFGGGSPPLAGSPDENAALDALLAEPDDQGLLELPRALFLHWLWGSPPGEPVLPAPFGFAVSHQH